MKHESFKHSLQDQTPGEPECLLFMTNGVEVRESSEGVIGRKPGQATAAPPTTCHRCGSLQPTSRRSGNGQGRREHTGDLSCGPEELGASSGDTGWAVKGGQRLGRGSQRLPAWQGREPGQWTGPRWVGAGAPGDPLCLREGLDDPQGSGAITGSHPCMDRTAHCGPGCCGQRPRLGGPRPRCGTRPYAPTAVRNCPPGR